MNADRSPSETVVLIVNGDEIRPALSLPFEFNDFEVDESALLPLPVAGGV